MVELTKIDYSVLNIYVDSQTYQAQNPAAVVLVIGKRSGAKTIKQTQVALKSSNYLLIPDR